MKKKGFSAKTSFWIKYRTWIILGSIILFLPPLSFLFQTTGGTAFCGTWCLRTFWSPSPDMTFQTIGARIARGYIGAGLFFLIIIGTLFFARYWCSHICPVGGFMEMVSRIIPEKLKIDYSAIPAPAVRYGYLFAFVAAPLFGIGSICCSYCNFGVMPRLVGLIFNPSGIVYFLRISGMISLALVVILGFLSKGGRGYCNFMCPVGAIDALINKLGAGFGLRMRVSKDKCTACGKCAEICPTWAIKVDEVAEISQLSCMPCRKCEVVCSVDAIGYGKKNKK
jgi:ferredoxin-type protein NapH